MSTCIFLLIYILSILIHFLGYYKVFLNPDKDTTVGEFLDDFPLWIFCFFPFVNTLFAIGYLIVFISKLISVCFKKVLGKELLTKWDNFRNKKILKR